MTAPQSGWWAVTLVAGAYSETPTLVIYREDDEGGQRRLVALDLPGADIAAADRALTRDGWQRLEDWGPMSEEGFTAQIARGKPGPVPGGVRLQVRLWLDDADAARDLIGVLAPDLSRVLAELIRRGLRSVADDGTR